MRLYRVQVINQTVLVARDEEEARRVALDVTFEPADVVSVRAQEVTESKDLPSPWTPNCVPFGGDDETTIGGILKKL